MSDRDQRLAVIARTNALVLLAVLAAACTAVVLPGPSAESRPPARTASPTPFDESTLLYPATARAFLDALNAARFDDAFAMIDEHFAFGGDCDYTRRNAWSISDRESARNWLQVRIADHDRIQIKRFIDVPAREHVLGFEISRSSDSIRATYPAGSIQPRAPMLLHFSLDGLRISQLAFVWTTPVAQFGDCVQ